MIGRSALLVALAITVVTALKGTNEFYEDTFVADKEFLLKQKIVFDILYHYNQPHLNIELYTVGQNYDLAANIDLYDDQAAVKDFLLHENFGILPHDAVYSVYYYQEETLAVFKVLYGAKDFPTFYKTALYLRNRVNHDLFAYTFYLAIIHRPDTQYIRLPPLYEILPYLFYNSELLEQAHHYDYFGTKESDLSPRKTYVLPYNYSGFYLNDNYDYNYENLLNYLTEDIGFNEYYFYFRNQYPFLLNSEHFKLNGERRGEEFVYGHKQILARYNLERLANGLGRVEHIDYHGKFYPGYYPTLTYPNGLPFPVRPWDSTLPKNKQHYVPIIEQYETRISDAIDSGFVLSKDGSKVDIYSPEGVNLLGNLLEGNADSHNKRYYGNPDEILRHIFGYNFDPNTRYQAHPSALEHFATSLRDPASYRIYYKFLHFYYRFYENQGPYQPEEIQFPEYKIHDVSVDKLVTFFEQYDSEISNGLAFHSLEEAKNVVIKARQYRLNHKPFTVNVTVEGSEAAQVAVRIFLGPKYDVHGRELEFSQYSFDYFYEIDNFIYNLVPGVNKIVRHNLDFTIDDNKESSYEFYSRVLEALKSDVEFVSEKRIYGFPSRLVLPKGTLSGLPLQLFVHVAPVVGEPLHYKSPVFGESLIDNRPFGYPLNRPVVSHDFHGSNLRFQEVRIFHEEH